MNLAINFALVAEYYLQDHSIYTELGKQRSDDTLIRVTFYDGYACRNCRYVSLWIP